MLNTERPDAEKLFSALLAGFDRKASPERLDAYWRGCNRMALPLLERVVDFALSERGPDSIPTPRQLWLLAREMRSPAAPRSPEHEEPQLDPLSAFANRTLFVFLCQRGAASQESLVELVSAKNAVVRAIKSPEGIEAEELRDVLRTTFAKLWRERTPEETAGDFDLYQHGRRARDFTPAELARIQA